MSSSGTDAFVEVSPGAYRLQAPLTFASVVSLRARGLAIIRAAAKGLTIDLSAVPAADSAGLALLVDWLAEAKSRSCQLKFDQASEALVALARLSDVEKLLVA